MTGELRILRQIEEDSLENREIRLVLYHRPLRKKIPIETEGCGLFNARLVAFL